MSVVVELQPTDNNNISDETDDKTTVRSSLNISFIRHVIAFIYSTFLSYLYVLSLVVVLLHFSLPLRSQWDVPGVGNFTFDTKR